MVSTSISGMFYLVNLMGFGITMETKPLGMFVRGLLEQVNPGGKSCVSRMSERGQYCPVSKEARR